MLTLVFRPLTAAEAPHLDLGVMAEETAVLLSDLTQAQVVTTETPVLGPNGAEVARHIRWHTFGTRDRLVLETTWHYKERTVIIDADRAAVQYHRFAAIWTVCGQAAKAGYSWAGAWWDGDKDPVLDNLWFMDANELWQEVDEESTAMPPFGRRELENGLVLEWLHPSVKIMKRLVYFAEECKIDWESLIIEDLMTETPATYLELREGRNTVALTRVLRETYLPGMEGYDPRSPRKAVEYEIESFEVHPKQQGRGLGAILINEVQRLRRPMSTLDTYRRAEKFWERVGFVPNPRRSSREDSNIFEWSPVLGEPVKSRTEDEE